MVAVVEVVFLVLLAVSGVVWLRRTPLYQAHRRSGWHASQHGSYATFGFASPRPTPPPEALHGQELRRRRWRRSAGDT